MVSASTRTAAPWGTTWTELRRVVLHPRTFQLRANQGREPRSGYGRINIPGPRNSIVTRREAATRCLSTQHVPGASAQAIGVKVGGGSYTATVGQSVQSSQTRGLSMTPENVSPELCAHESVKLSRAVYPKTCHNLGTLAIRKVASRKKTVRKIFDFLDGGLMSHHVSRSFNSRNFIVPLADRHKLADRLQCDPGSGQEDRGALDQERHASGVSSAQWRTFSSFTDHTTPQECGKHFVRQNNGIAPYPNGESSQSIIKERLRHCMRQVPQSVAIITAMDIANFQHAWRGATVSSFTTVTFEPEVVVSLNLKLPSTTYNAILSSNHFDIHMLKATARGAELASRFAAGHVAFHLEPAEKETSAMDKRLQSSSSTFPPVSSESQGAQNEIAFGLSCLYMPEKTVQIGDHAVLFGKVEAIARKSYDLHAGETTTCLAYIDGCYGYVEPLSKQPKREPTRLSSNKNRDAPSGIAEQSPISRKDFVAFASHAQNCAECFRKSFLSEVYLGGLQPRTLLGVRKLRLHGGHVHCAILNLSRAAKSSSSLLQNHSSLLIGIHRLLAFHFIFCGSRHLTRHESFYLPESVQRHLKVFLGHLFEIESTIRTIRNGLDTSVFPDPHPLYALQKAPRRMDLALQYVQNYANWFIAGQQLDTASGERWHLNLVIPYVTRMRLMNIWLRYLWPSESNAVSLSLIDSLLNVPTCYLMPVRNGLVLCAHQMILPPSLLNAAREIRHKPFKRSLVHYNQFCKCLWRGLDRMTLHPSYRTFPGIRRQWRHADTMHKSRRPVVSMDVHSANHKIAIKTTSMKKETERTGLTKKEQDAQKGYMEIEDDPAGRLHESRKGNHADLQVLPKNGIKNLGMDLSTSVNERPPILSENGKLYMLNKTSSSSSNRPLDHSSSTMRKLKVAVNSIPTLTLPFPSILTLPFRGFSSTKTMSRSVEDIDYSGRSSKSGDPRDESMASIVRGTLHVPLSRSMRTISAQTMGSIPDTAFADGGTLDERVMNTDLNSISRKQISVKASKAGRVRVTKIYPFIRHAFVDDPVFRKVFTDEIATHGTELLDRHQINDDSNSFAVSEVRRLDTTAIRKHYARGESGTAISVQHVGLRSRKKGHKKISNRDQNETSTLINRVLIRKHLVRDNGFLPLSASHNQAQSNSSTTAGKTEDIEALVKALLYGSDIRIRKQLTTNKWDDHSEVSLPSRMSDDLDQVLREKIELVMREAPNRQHMPLQVLPEEAAFKQHQKMQKMAKRQAMERDIEDIMDQIQGYFQRRSGASAA